MGHLLVSDFHILCRNRGTLICFLLLAGTLFALYVAVPVLFIPGNDLRFYVSVTPWWGFLLLLLLALHVSFALIFRIVAGPCKQCARGQDALGNSALVAGSVLPSVLTCPILAVSVLSFFLPITSIWALVGYRWLIIFFALLGMSGITALRYWRLAYSLISKQYLHEKYII